MSPQRTTLFVIFTSPQQHGRPGTRYIAKDGTQNRNNIAGRQVLFFRRRSGVRETDEHRTHCAHIYWPGCLHRFRSMKNPVLSWVSVVGNEGHDTTMSLQN